MSQHSQIPLAPHERTFEQVCAWLKERGFHIAAKWTVDYFGCQERHKLTAGDEHLGEGQWWAPEYHDGEKPHIEDTVPDCASTPESYSDWEKARNHVMDERWREIEANYDNAEFDFRELTEEQKFENYLERIKRLVRDSQGSPGDWNKVGREAEDLLRQARSFLRSLESGPVCDELRERMGWGVIFCAVDAGIRMGRLGFAPRIGNVLHSMRMRKGEGWECDLIRQTLAEMRVAGNPSNKAKDVVQASGGDYRRVSKDGKVVWEINGGKFNGIRVKEFQRKLREVREG